VLSEENEALKFEVVKAGALLFWDLHELCEFFSFVASFRGGEGNEVWREFSDGSTSTPEEGFPENGGEDFPEGDGGAIELSAFLEVIVPPSAGEVLGHVAAPVGSHSHGSDVGPEV